MAASLSVRGYGPIMQLGYVVRDFEGAIKFWSGEMGVGPFFQIEHVPFDGSQYLGQPSAVDITTAIAYWGDVQIELIRQHNAIESTFKAWYDSGGTGVHHLCVQVDDLESVRRRCIEAGGTVVQEAWMNGAGHFIYVDLGNEAATLVEFAELHPTFKDLFAYMRRAAVDWDGRGPLRPIPPASTWNC